MIFFIKFFLFDHEKEHEARGSVVQECLCGSGWQAIKLVSGVCRGDGQRIARYGGR